VDNLTGGIGAEIYLPEQVPYLPCDGGAGAGKELDRIELLDFIIVVIFRYAVPFF
jgi:hypothetical protein